MGDWVTRRSLFQLNLQCLKRRDFQSRIFWLNEVYSPEFAQAFADRVAREADHLADPFGGNFETALVWIVFMQAQHHCDQVRFLRLAKR